MNKLKRMKAVLWIIFDCYFLFGSQDVFAQAGTLDPFFGEGGKVSIDFLGDLDRSLSVAVQNDQKLIIAGFVQSGDNRDFALARLNPDGSLDESFGDNGKVVQKVGRYSYHRDRIRDVLFQADGKIIAVGSSYGINAASEDLSNVVVCRYNLNGTLDPTFGGNGTMIYDLSGAYDFANAGYIQNDGKIVIVGHTGYNGSGDFLIIRVNSDGSLDNSFGTGGQKKIDFGDFDNVTSVSVAGDGRIYIAGYTQDNAASNLKREMVICRLNSDGSLSSNFANNGKLILPLGGISSEARDLLITPSNEILVLGNSSTVTGTNDFALVKLSVDGNLVNSFGDNGKVIANYGYHSSTSYSMGLQSDGKIIVSGYSDRLEGMTMKHDYIIARYSSDGLLDNGFGENGVVASDFSRGDVITLSCTIQSDDKIVLGGSFTLFNNPRDFSIVRYLTNEKLRISNDTVICSGYVDDIVLEAFDGLNSYHWIDSLHPSVELGSEKTLTVKPLETTTYGVISGIDTAYCKVTVDDPVVAKFSINEKEGKVIFKPTIVNESIGGDYYSWDFGNSTKVDVSHAEDLAVQRTYYPIYGYAGEFNIRLDVTRSSGCKDSAFTQVMVSYKPQVNPTAFSPNDDGLNDTFNYKISNAIRIEGNIYNRWGEKIYSMNTNDNVFSWDGSQNSLHSPMGCYIYALKSTDIRGETKTISGRVLLVR